MNHFSIYVYSCPVKIISTAQTDLSLRYRTFSEKINKLPTVSKIIQVRQYFKIVFMCVTSVLMILISTSHYIDSKSVLKMNKQVDSTASQTKTLPRQKYKTNC